jgi:hypothetical protein
MVERKSNKEKTKVNINYNISYIFIDYLNVSNLFMQILRQDQKEANDDTKIKIPLYVDAMSVCAC